MTSAITVVGVGGWDRSGSTILSNILGSYGGLVSVGELNNLWQRGVVENRLCSCGEHFSTCGLWKPVMDSAFGDEEGGRLLDAVVRDTVEIGNTRALLRRLVGRSNQVDRRYGEAMVRLYRAIGEQTGANAIIDSSKIPWHLLLVSDLPEIRFVLAHLIRDPRGVVFSHRKSMAYDPDPSRPLQMNQFGTVFTSLGWQYRNLIFSAAGRRQERVEILYEDFTSDPAGVVARFLESVGLDVESSPWVSPGVVRLVSNHVVSGNPVRFRQGEIAVSTDDQWKTDLPVATQRLIEVLTWPSSRKYGYE